MHLAATHLNKVQTALLMAVYRSNSPEETHAILMRNSRTVAAAAALEQMGLVSIGEEIAALTDAGSAELATTGLVDGATGDFTEYGQRFFQQNVNALNEFHIIRDLMLL